MSVALRAGPGVVDAAENARSTPFPGRITVSESALLAVAEQEAARALGVPRARVSVRLGSAAGGLALRVAAPLPIPDLGDTAAVRSAATVRERVRTIQQQLHERVAGLTGRDVTRVDVTVTGAIIPPRRRVR